MRIMNVPPEYLEDMFYSYMAKALLEIQKSKKKEVKTTKVNNLSSKHTK